MRLGYPTDVPGCRQAMAAPPKTYTPATRPRRTSRSPSRRTWGRRGRTAVVTVTGGSNTRVSLAALIAVKPGQRPRLIYRVHRSRRPRGDKPRGFTEADYARLLDDARQQPGGPLVVWDNLNTHVSAAMGELVAARDWLTVVQLPPYAHELNPAGPVWSHLKRSLASLASRNIGQLTALVRTRGETDAVPARPAGRVPRQHRLGPHALR
jgi:transposase